MESVQTGIWDKYVHMLRNDRECIAGYAQAGCPLHLARPDRLVLRLGRRPRSVVHEAPSTEQCPYRPLMPHESRSSPRSARIRG